jgi:hypothetical protein
MKELTQASFGLPPLAHREEAERSMRPPAVEDEAINLRDCWRAIRTHLRLIALLCVGTVLAATLIILLMTPIYTAETTLLIERNTPQVLTIKDVVSEPLGPDEYDFYKTQYEILKSRMLAARVIREQHLATNRIFTGAGTEIRLVTKLWGDAKRWATQQPWARPLFTRVLDTGAEPSLGAEPGLIDDAMVDRYRQMLEIQPVSARGWSKSWPRRRIPSCQPAWPTHTPRPISATGLASASRPMRRPSVFWRTSSWS